jgi:hypothetical protein
MLGHYTWCALFYQSSVHALQDTQTPLQLVGVHHTHPQILWESLWIIRTPQGLGKDWARTAGGPNEEPPAKCAISSPPPVQSTWSGPYGVPRRIRTAPSGVHMDSIRMQLIIAHPWVWTPTLMCCGKNECAVNHLTMESWIYSANLSHVCHLWLIWVMWFDFNGYKSCLICAGPVF